MQNPSGWLPDLGGPAFEERVTYGGGRVLLCIGLDIDKTDGILP